MKATLKDQLEFLLRTTNPNYLIIVQNKADENMDFSKFKIHESEVQEKKKVKEKRYIISHIAWSETQYRVLVKDSHFNNRVVYDCTCNTDKLEHNLLIAKQQYRGDLEKI